MEKYGEFKILLCCPCPQRLFCKPFDSVIMSCPISCQTFSMSCKSGHFFSSIL
uniref:Uncharacterized protein n=1 Tax=Lepeophtheirus salmonis TaxID=72036 RepID=A0A0K2VG85_LEPSM